MGHKSRSEAILPYIDSGTTIISAAPPPTAADAGIVRGGGHLNIALIMRPRQRRTAARVLPNAAHNI